MTPEEETFSILGEPAPVIDEHGNKFWYNEKGQMHRENDLPAIIYKSGMRFWFKNGKKHRDVNNGPAIILENGIRQYWENDIYLIDQHFKV